MKKIVAMGVAVAGLLVGVAEPAHAVMPGKCQATLLNEHEVGPPAPESAVPDLVLTAAMTADDATAEYTTVTCTMYGGWIGGSKAVWNDTTFRSTAVLVEELDFSSPPRHYPYYLCTTVTWDDYGLHDWGCEYAFTW